MDHGTHYSNDPLGTIATRYQSFSTTRWFVIHPQGHPFC